MKYRDFNKTGRQVSEVGAGCWQFGGDWGEVSDEQAIATLHAAVEAGVTFFDTADVYGGGRSESLIGQFLKESGRSKGLFVATKLGRFSEPGGDANYTSQAMRAHTEASLQRLGVEALDLTQLHCIPTEQLQRGDVFETLRALKAEGKIKAFGASVESMAEADLCLGVDGLSSLQIIFNIFRQKPIATLFDAAFAKQVAIIVRLPLASGLLSGKMTAQTHFAPQDHRSYNRDGEAFNVGETFAGLPFELGVQLADQVKEMTGADASSQPSMAQVALRWCLDFDAVTTIIPGAKSPEMARVNAAAADLAPLSAASHEQLARFYSESVASAIRGPY